MSYYTMGAKALLLTKYSDALRGLKSRGSQPVSYEPSGRQTRRINGMTLTLDLSYPGHREIFRSRVFEADLTSAIIALCPAGRAFIDIGANIGWHCISLLLKRPDVPHCYAYEPSAKMHAMLQENIIQNNLQGRC